MGPDHLGTLSFGVTTRPPASKRTTYTPDATGAPCPSFPGPLCHSLSRGAPSNIERGSEDPSSAASQGIPRPQLRKGSVEESVDSRPFL